MTSSPRDNAHFRTLDDGTVLYRRNRATLTYIVTGEQRELISNLRGKEIAAAFLLAPPIPIFVVTTAFGDFGLLWQITGAYVLIYCVLNFFLSQRISREIESICQSARPALLEQRIEFATLHNSLKNVTANLSPPERLALFVFFLLNAVVSLLLISSIFIDIGFMKLSDLHWAAKLLFGTCGILFFGMLAFGALQIILEKRASKRNV